MNQLSQSSSASELRLALESYWNSRREGLQTALPGVSPEETDNLLARYPAGNKQLEEFERQFTQASSNIRAEHSQVSGDLNIVLLHHFSGRLVAEGQKIFSTYHQLQQKISQQALSGATVPVLVEDSFSDDEGRIDRGALVLIEPSNSQIWVKSEFNVRSMLMHAATGRMGDVEDAKLHMLGITRTYNGSLNETARIGSCVEQSLVLSHIQESVNPRDGFSMSSYGFSNSRDSRIAQPQGFVETRSLCLVGWDELQDYAATLSADPRRRFIENLNALLEGVDLVDMPAPNALLKHLQNLRRLKAQEQEFVTSLDEMSGPARAGFVP